MNKFFLPLFLIFTLFIAGCTGGNRADDIIPAPEESEYTEAPAEPPATQPEAPVLPDEATSATGLEQRLGSAVKDAYAGIEIDAFIRERKAVLPGFAVPLTVTVKNTGDEAVDYICGSGRYETPEALFLSAGGLQPVMPKDHLGPVTMDFRTSTLQPGDELEFTMYLMAVEPNEKFDLYTIEMYNDSEKYIAEAEWPELQERFPGLAAVKPGSYSAGAYFMYYTRGEGAEPGAATFTTGPTGYAEHEFTISVG